MDLSLCKLKKLKKHGFDFFASLKKLKEHEFNFLQFNFLQAYKTQKT